MADAANTAQDRIEQLALSCLDAFELEGEAAVQRVCAGNAADVAAVLSVLRSLSRYGLLSEVPPDANGPQPGTQLGDFLLLQRLGGGGMGVVYLAEQQNLRRRVALKLLRPGCLDSARARARFRREIEVISRLDHAGICTVYEAGEVDDRPYLAMRYVEGETLASRLQRQRAQTTAQGRSATTSGSTAEVLLLVEKIARALHYAHEHGVVHRDVKPGNVIVTADGEPVLLDFGLAIASEEESSLTLSGDVLGTPAYMAPEQVKGDRGAVDRHTDVYALGAVLYECLSLHPPFTAATRDDLYRQILTEPPPDLRKTVRGVGGELWAVLSRALEKEPRRRFASALEFAEDLQRLRLHQPIQTRRPGPVLRGLRWCQRNRAAAAVLGTALAGLVVALVLLQVRNSDLVRLRAALHASEAANLGLRDPILGFKLAREAVQLDPSSPTNIERLHAALGTLHELKQLPAGYHPYCARYSADGTCLLIAHHDGILLYSADGSGPILDRPRTRSADWTPGGLGPADLATGRRELAFGTSDGWIQIFDLDGSPVRSWQHGAPITLIRWSPDDACILAVDEGGGAVLYTAEGSRIAPLVDPDIGRAHLHRPFDAVWAADGSFVVTADGYETERAQGATPFDSRVWMWDRQGRPIRRLPGPTHEVYRLAICGDRVAAADFGGFPWLWDFHGNVLHSEQIAKDIVTSVAFDRTGGRVVFTTLNSKGLVRVVDREGQKKEWCTGSSMLCPVAFTPDNAQLVTACMGGLIRFWDPGDTAFAQLRLFAPSNGFTSVAFSADGRQFVSTSWDGKARIWQTEPIGARVLRCDRNGLRALVATADGTRMVSVSSTGELVLRDADGTPLGKTAPAKEEEPTGLSIGPDGHTVLAAWSKRLILWDLREPDRPRELSLPWAGAQAARLLPDRRILVAVGEKLYRWDPDSKVTPQPIHVMGEEILSIEPLPDGRLALGGNRGTIEILDRDGTAHPLAGHTDGVRWLACSSEGHLLLSGSGDCTARLWDLATLRPIRPFEGQQHWVTWCAFVPGNEQVVTAGGDYMLRVFDVATGRFRRLPQHNGFVRPGFVTADGRQVVSASDDGTIRWSWLRAEDVRTAANDVARQLGIGPLTDEELARLPQLQDSGR